MFGCLLAEGLRLLSDKWRLLAEGLGLLADKADLLSDKFFSPG